MKRIWLHSVVCALQAPSQPTSSVNYDVKITSPFSPINEKNVFSQPDILSVFDEFVPKYVCSFLETIDVDQFYRNDIQWLNAIKTRCVFIRLAFKKIQALKKIS